MTIHIDAIYEHGTFRPASPVKLEEGAQVVLTIETQAPSQSPQRIAAARAEVAAMPAQSPEDEFSGADKATLLREGSLLVLAGSMPVSVDDVNGTIDAGRSERLNQIVGEDIEPR
jgi:predicted DNA-binding antitoxin AbrB/MazE fold protein